MNTLLRIIDFETTGFEPPAEVIEVGMADLHGDLSIVLGPSYLCHADEVPAESRAIHHIWPEDLVGLPKFDPRVEIDRAHRDGVRAFVAHNAEFEQRWMGDEIPFICTYKASLRMLEFAPTHTNFGLAYFLMDNGLISIERKLMTPSHRSLPDATVTAHLLRLLISEGATVEQLVQWTKEPRLLPTCPIGKWRGSPWSEVDLGFLEWVLGKDFDDDVKWNVRNEIANRNS